MQAVICKVFQFVQCMHNSIEVMSNTKFNLILECIKTEQTQLLWAAKICGVDEINLHIHPFFLLHRRNLIKI